jgi:hypothetical protein
MPKPSLVPRWNLDGTNRSTPSSDKIDEGWTFGEDPSSALFNFLGHYAGEWAEWCNATAADDLDDIGSAFFGDGSAGPIIVGPGTTTLTEDLLATDITVQSGGILEPNGYRIFAIGTVDIQAGGSVVANGANGSNGVSMTDAPGGTAIPSGSILSGHAGAAGRGGFTGAGIAATAHGAGTYGLGGVGGAGGQTGSFAGGAAGTLSTSATSANSRFLYRRASHSINGLALALVAGTITSTRARGGTGGGGGAVNGIDSSGGAGGASGGLIIITARRIVLAGEIQAIGGNGGNASSFFGSIAAGGGGGGGGGAVLLNTRRLIGSTADIYVDGGFPGNGVHAGSIGDAGSDGLVQVLTV